MSAENVTAWFGQDSALAQKLAGYTPRLEQQKMAAHVTRALETGGQLLVEAGTGTGKTLAYLLPAMASGRKIIVATATRHLQDQIYNKDVPQARAALNKSLRVALLKGRSNYLCLHRLHLAEQGGGHLQARGYAQLRRIRQWATRTRTGDINEIGDNSDASRIWPRVTSTADNCLGTNCPQFDKCWVVEARRAAQAADLVIANHHLLFADMALREEGFGEVLPGADAVILDEAHKLPDIAGRFFGHTLSGRQLRDLARDGFDELKEAGGDMPGVAEVLESLVDAEEGFRDETSKLAGNVDLNEALSRNSLATALQTLETVVGDLTEAVKSVAERTEGLEAILRRATQASQRFIQLRDPDNSTVSWLERRGVGWILHVTPLDVAPQFQRGIQTHNGAWIFTSATLSVGGKLDYFASRLGLENAEQLVLDSPFDFKNNALLYLPENLPEPRDRDFDAASVNAILPLLRASQGGAFYLCTSHRALKQCAQLLAAAGISPLLVQGDMGRGELLQEFRRNPHAVLVGTNSFWEGVDVRGQGLRLVIIDRLPFASPADPVLQARMRAMRAEGEQPFTQYQLPQAVITLKQGVGRLIRDSQDRGALVICDPRLRTKGYGKVFLRSLPSMAVTRDVDAVTNFLQTLAPT